MIATLKKLTSKKGGAYYAIIIEEGSLRKFVFVNDIEAEYLQAHGVDVTDETEEQKKGKK